jgi:hypothetical protein
MAKNLSSVNTTSDTFGSMVSKINSLVTFANTETVSANTTGALTVGVGFVQGQFGANTLAASFISGGNTSVAANLSFSTNTSFQSSLLANTGLSYGNTGVATVNAFTYASTNTSQQTLDQFAVSSWRSGKYVVTVTDPGSLKYQTTELLILQDGANAYTTEYATLSSNGILASFVADVSAGNCRLLVTPGTAVLTITVDRTLNAV